MKDERLSAKQYILSALIGIAMFVLGGYVSSVRTEAATVERVNGIETKCKQIEQDLKEKASLPMLLDFINEYRRNVDETKDDLKDIKNELKLKKDK